MTGQTASQPFVFELNRLTEYTDAAILDELRRVAAIAPDGPMLVRVFLQHSHVSQKPVLRRFGRWSNALAAAGLSDRCAEVLHVPGAPERMTNDQILAALADLACKLGKAELTVSDVKVHLPFSCDTLRRRWGSSRAAFVAAGLSLSKLGSRYTDEECFDNLLAVWTHHGRPPKCLEMGLPPSTVGGKAYMSRFGSWKKALAAFVERVSANSDSADTTTGLSAEALAEQLPVAAQESTRDKRGITLGLRFRVLHRDRFKCVLCGDSPSINPACALHVDHIVPWSKGGRTAMDNLRSLCGPCNLGRGNRYED